MYCLWFGKAIRPDPGALNQVAAAFHGHVVSQNAFVEDLAVPLNVTAKAGNAVSEYCSFMYLYALP